MKYMNFSKANCKNCYKCLRSCPVKAIKFKNEQAEIVEDRCIACSHCLEVCPQNARKLQSDLDKVKCALNSGKKVIASVAPSFAGNFNMDYKKFLGILRKLGFSHIEETAVGAKIVSSLYGNYMEEKGKINYISTACPSANYLVEKYYPELIELLIPVVSPMIAHGKLMKKTYGEHSFVVFIGPCFGKKIESEGMCFKEAIDAVLTFEELTKWIKDEGIEEVEESDFDRNVSAERGYPEGGGIIETIRPIIDEIGLQSIAVSGVEDCMDVLNSIKEGYIKNTFIEISACKGSCIGGPVMAKGEGGYYKRLNSVKNYIKNKKCIEIDKKEFIDIEELDLCRKFEDKKILESTVLEEDIKKIMMDMGKHTKEDELNCGVCGYNTCMDKAKAIHENMAETNMCLHYMRNRAESLRNVIFENTLNCVMLLDGNMLIKDINPSVEKAFSINRENIINKSLSIFMEEEDFKKVRITGESIINKKVSCLKYGLDFMVTAVYIKEQDIVMVAMMNITEEEKSKKEIMKLKENTIHAAQQVIEKQMRVAQEIAGLLGETTAETKITLTKLKKIVEGENKIL